MARLTASAHLAKGLSNLHPRDRSAFAIEVMGYCAEYLKQAHGPEAAAEAAYLLGDHHVAERERRA